MNEQKTLHNYGELKEKRPNRTVDMVCPLVRDDLQLASKNLT